MCTGNTFSLYFCPITNHGVVKYVLTSVGQFSEWVTYSLDISPGYVFIYPLVLKISDNQFWYITMVFKKKIEVKEAAKELSICCWFFHENRWFFEVFDKTGIGGSLRLNFFRELKTVVFSFWIFSEPERAVLQKNSKNHPTLLVLTSHLYQPT